MTYARLSTDFLNGSSNSLMGRVVNLYGNSYTPGEGPQYGILSQPGRTWWGGYNNGNTGNLRIMTGNKPQSVNNLSNSNPPAGTAIIAQILSLSDSGYFNPTVARWYSDPTSISTIFIECVGSGVATWFWICVMNTINGGTVWHNIIGDVGLIGSGSDMEVAETFITAGQFCRIVSLKLKLPTPFYG